MGKTSVFPGCEALHSRPAMARLRHVARSFHCWRQSNPQRIGVVAGEMTRFLLTRHAALAFSDERIVV